MRQSLKEQENHCCRCSSTLRFRFFEITLLFQRGFLLSAEVIDDEEFMNADPYRGLQIVYDIHMHILKKMFTEEQVHNSIM